MNLNNAPRYIKTWFSDFSCKTITVYKLPLQYITGSRPESVYSHSVGRLSVGSNSNTRYGVLLRRLNWTAPATLKKTAYNFNKKKCSSTIVLCKINDELENFYLFFTTLLVILLTHMPDRRHGWGCSLFGGRDGVIYYCRLVMTCTRCSTQTMVRCHKAQISRDWIFFGWQCTRRLGQILFIFLTFNHLTRLF